MPTQREILAFLAAARDAVRQDAVVLTEKALDETFEHGWSEAEVLHEILELLPSDLEKVEGSLDGSGEAIWTFTPPYGPGDSLWIRLKRSRANTLLVVISFHVSDP